eukprot:CAMPEP_0197175864 /NCGR_PEP_ID=MMETSP1423-20130617/1967_1 /TAXON_ID=476441 /ORGANISM="Pseudo-nitzschia heimii, Strain UNC1101" /LENGTH=326 /DNA_ID=CAMNT_0042625113 /DNA_START=105 /DNA_END=1086 /DNA_ORIENTATION=+
MGQTKYSRKTRNKNTLSASMNTPRLGSNACSLCAERSIPENLNAHVNDDQTCADVHLQLSMLRYDNAMCAVGQEKYRDLCCTAKNSSDFKSALGFMIGAVVAGAFLKKIVSRRKRRARQENEYDSDAVPGTVSFSSRSSGSSSRSGRIDLEMPSSHYMKMDESENFKKIKSPKTNRGKKDRYPSRPRDRLDRIQSSPHSRGRHSSRTRDRSRSRSRPRVKPEAYRSNRDRPMSEVGQEVSVDRETCLKNPVRTEIDRGAVVDHEAVVDQETSLNETIRPQEIDPLVGMKVGVEVEVEVNQSILEADLKEEDLVVKVVREVDLNSKD